MSRTGENIYKRKDGRWEVRYIPSYEANGKAKYKYLYAHTYTGVKAKLIRAQNHATFSSGKEKSKDNEKYEYWLDEWLRAKRLSVKESTFIRYRDTIENHIKPDLGKYPISKISTPIIIFVFLLLTRFFSRFHFFMEMFSKSMPFPLAKNHGYPDI